VGSSLLDHELIRDNNIIIQHFPDLQFPDTFMAAVANLPTRNKLFQYHKFHLFNSYFKKWDTILYIDCGMKIYADIRPILDTIIPDTLLAHSDAYPTYKWKLHTQFNRSQVEIFNDLNENYNLDIDYFQTTMMLYDTSIIQENTFYDLYQLAIKYPLSLTNDQGIIALYFTNIFPVWKQIPTSNERTYFYDFTKRNKNKNYIMIKY
jgi:hypothetical protein